jgi:gentisate 1,2-dioxygenase
VSEVKVVALESVEPIELPGGSWSRMLITGERAAGTGSSIGFSTFKPHSRTPSVRHEVEELAFVVSGSGHLELEADRVEFGKGDAIHVPPDLWHAVVNDSDEEITMVFGFPHPDYPPTERV